MALPGRHFVSSYLLLHGKPMAMQKEIKSVALKEFGCFIFFFFFYLFLTIFSFFISSHFNSSWSSTRSNHLPDRIKYLLHWEINLSQMLMRDRNATLWLHFTPMGDFLISDHCSYNLWNWSLLSWKSFFSHSWQHIAVQSFQETS